jgi:pimeloyl-ACP methyl ester carboxylesterase
MSVNPFTVHIPANVLDDLRDRLARTRWADASAGSGWDAGTNLVYLQELTSYWQSEFDWRAQERSLNSFKQFRADISGTGIHFIHEHGKGPQPLPLILTHGWPDTFYRFYKLIPMLTDPEHHGGDPADSFDVVVPSLPGHGFSDRLAKPGFTAQTAGLWARLMTETLGYPRFAAHGGDVGSSVTEQLAHTHADALIGMHLTDVPYWHLFAMQPQELSEEEQHYLEAGQQWSKTEGAYAMIQSTKPQTLAYGLNDSPAGLAAWIVEKFRSWSDCDGNVESRFTKDELLTNLTIYWATQTIGSSFRFYYDAQHMPPSPELSRHVDLPTGVAIFPKDLAAPRAFAERLFNVQHWTQMPRGGHFAALEEPTLLAEDLRAFFRPLRRSSRA